MVVVMVVVMVVEVRIGKRTLPWWLFKQAAEDGAECVFQVQRICLLILRNESKQTKKKIGNKKNICKGGWCIISI